MSFNQSTAWQYKDSKALHVSVTYVDLEPDQRVWHTEDTWSLPEGTQANKLSCLAALTACKASPQVQLQDPLESTHRDDSSALPPGPKPLKRHRCIPLSARSCNFTQTFEKSWSRAPRMYAPHTHERTHPQDITHHLTTLQGSPREMHPTPTKTPAKEAHPPPGTAAGMLWRRISGPCSPGWPCPPRLQLPEPSLHPLQQRRCRAHPPLNPLSLVVMLRKGPAAGPPPEAERERGSTELVLAVLMLRFLVCSNLASRVLFSKYREAEPKEAYCHK
eukprot:1158307-Pelagomonas_calceolata.AAC.7